MLVIDLLRYISPITSVQFSRSVVSYSLRPHGLQHARPPCPSPTPGAYSNSCPLSQWCHPTISSSVVPFSSCLQSFPAPGSFQMSQFFASSGQSNLPIQWIHFNGFKAYPQLQYHHYHQITTFSSSPKETISISDHPPFPLPLLLATTFCLYRFTYSRDFI